MTVDMTKWQQIAKENIHNRHNSVSLLDECQ